MDFNESYHNKISRVCQAARKGNVVVLKELLQKGYPTKGRDNRGFCPLHAAAAGGHVECVRLLLAADDAEVDAIIHESRTALYFACEPGEGHIEAVKLLLSAGADPNMKCGNLWKLPLQKAILNDLYDIVKLLLDAGCDPNQADVRTCTPLMVAADKGHLKIARLLIERRAKVDSCDKIRRNALHILLLPPIRIAEESVLVQFIDLLAENGLDVNTSMGDGTTPLMLAVQCNRAGAVSRLLELGADPNAKMSDMSNYIFALHFAIKYCPDPSTEEHDGSNSEDSTTDYVLRRILNLTSREIVTPKNSKQIENSIFHLAIDKDKLNSLKLMVNAGLSPDAFLQRRADTTFVSLLRQVHFPMENDKCIKVDTPLGFLLSKPLSKKSVEMAKFMIDKGSSVNPVVPKCLPPLVAAVKHQRAHYTSGCPGLDILQYMLNNSVDVMHKICQLDIVPSALHVSSLFNVHAFFALLVRCVPVHEIYTPEALEYLSKRYKSLRYYELYPLLPWRVISWLSVVDAFVPQLPLDTKQMFDIHRMVKDENLSSAWNALDAQIGSPKKLEQLCVLAVRREVGKCKGWNSLSDSLQKLTLMNEPLPDIIMDLLMFKQMESSSLHKWPPRTALELYVESGGATSSRSSNSSSHETVSTDESDEEANIVNYFNEAMHRLENGDIDNYIDDDDDDDSDGDNDDNEHHSDEDGGDNDDNRDKDGVDNIDNRDEDGDVKEEDDNGEEEQKCNSLKEVKGKEEKEENKRKKIKTE